MKKEDDIMAGYLLKGGKMLAKTCPDCGCPIFQYKDRTFCVVCAERKTESPEDMSAKSDAGLPAGPVAAGNAYGPSRNLQEALEQVMVILADRASREPEPKRCLTLMEAVREGAEALSLLSRR